MAHTIDFEMGIPNRYMAHNVDYEMGIPNKYMVHTIDFEMGIPKKYMANTIDYEMSIPNKHMAHTKLVEDAHLIVNDVGLVIADLPHNLFTYITKNIPLNKLYLRIYL